MVPSEGSCQILKRFYTVTFLFSDIAKITDVNDITNAVRKIKLYASWVGKLPEITLYCSSMCLLKHPAIDGPID